MMSNPVEKMEKQKAFELLKECLAGLEHLRSLRWDNEDEQQWRFKVMQIVEYAFGKDSEEYGRLVNLPPVSVDKSDSENQQEYLRDLARHEVIIKGIVQKMHTTDIPKYLFDTIQLHPRIIRASKSLFHSGHYAEAIFAAFKAVNNFTKRKAGQALDGKDLMAKVFNEDKPIIKLNKLVDRSERDEQEGFRFLYMGAMVGIRNPKAHDDIRQIDPYKALEYLAFASLLMRRVTEGKLESKGTLP